MGSILFEDLAFSGSIQVTENDWERKMMGLPWKAVPNDDHAGYEVSAQKLKVQSTNLVFKGSVLALGPSASRARWQAGFIQNITALHRIAHYSGHHTYEKRQNPAYLPIRDGDDDPDTAPWFDTDSGRERLVEATVDVEMNDSPYFSAPLKLQGTGAFAPPRLLRTSGNDQFQLFLALVREDDKSILVLEQIDWSVDYTGTLNTQGFGPSAAKVWNATNPPVTRWQRTQFSGHHAINLAKTQQNAQAQLGFSPDCGCGFDNFESKSGNGGWISNGAPNAGLWVNLASDR